MASVAWPDSYLDAHRYDGAVIQHDRRERLMTCTIQPRDLALIADVRRHKFLTAPQLLELWWPGGVAWPGQRRLRKLFQAGLLERFRPIARRGSFPWTYHLGERGHRLLQEAGLLDHHVRYRPRAIYDYSTVLHELQLNAWVLACRRLLGPRLLRWEGETDIAPPTSARPGQQQLGTNWTAHGLRTPQPRLLRPDTILELAGPDEHDPKVTRILVEFDRTRRLDKNYDKFRRYDTFLNAWWLNSSCADQEQPPEVLFVCQDPQQREQFIRGADHQLTGHRRHSTLPPEQHRYIGRQRLLFAVESDAHHGLLEGWRLPAFPPNHPARSNAVEQLTLAAPSPPGRPADQLSLPSGASDQASGPAVR
jgi:hypothetical protein